MGKALVKRFRGNFVWFAMTPFSESLASPQNPWGFHWPFPHVKDYAVEVHSDAGVLAFTSVQPAGRHRGPNPGIAALSIYLFKQRNRPRALFDSREISMNTRMIVMASFAALAIGVGVPGVAAEQDQNQAGGAGMMRAAQEPGPVGPGGHMGGMMGACPAMTGAGLDPGTAMRMHGEMMRAMGDILVKYADKVQSSPPKP